MVSLGKEGMVAANLSTRGTRTDPLPQRLLTGSMSRILAMKPTIENTSNEIALSSLIRQQASE